MNSTSESSIRYLDTHAHVNLDAFTDDREAVITRAVEAGVAHINVGTTVATSQQAVDIAAAHEATWSIVGMHPTESALGFDAAVFRNLANHESVVGIGECGFDYYRLEADTKAQQEAVFIEQIKLANELKLPLMIHTRPQQGNQPSASGVGRNVYDDVYDVLKRHATVPGNIHFYAGSWEQAKKFFDIGFTISFTGVITFASDYEEVVKNAPLDRVHAETDCPFVAPHPYRGKRCEPHMVTEVYKKIATVKAADEETVRTQLLANAVRQYGLPLSAYI